MGYKMVLFSLLFFASYNVCGQARLFVNTDNLILRDRPEHKYRVFAILHAPCEVHAEPYGKDYQDKKAVTDKFYHVSVSFTDSAGIHHYIGGWVEKKYMAAKLSAVHGLKPGKVNGVYADQIMLMPYAGPDEHNPNPFNADRYQAPEFKGGERQTAAGEGKRTYHRGARGGCYYLSGKGRKVYVDKRFCK